MKRLTTFAILILVFSCQKNPSIKWEDKKSFAEVVDSAGEKYVMIDFVKDG